MKIGTKSVLFGAHCWCIHPFFVAAAWSKLYGFPKDYRLWAAFFVHDLGYIGKPNIDGPEGETHVELGAKIMHRFDGPQERAVAQVDPPSGFEKTHRIVCRRPGIYGEVFEFERGSTEWRDLCLYHSRYYAKAAGVEVSKLCAADKLATILEPYWLYMPRIWLSGELKEFRANALTKYGRERWEVCTPKAWYLTMRKVIREWLVAEGFDVG